METLQVFSAGTPPGWGCRAAAPAAASPAAKPSSGPRIVEDKENVLPSGTPLGGPQLLQFSSTSCGKKAHEAAPVRRPLGDVTQHYESKGLCIGTMGGSFAHNPSTCGQEAAAAMQAAAAAAAAAAAEAAQARRVAAKRQALRAMR
ncbi:hypothetical protein C2E20_5928 [Micractinium conductrix]|uniref:Uncharacterized protein n=1 Tax=Micractinium conductrix TaxID=554055 RepID=A0A2P6V9K4_9CHLO|nr:hypothetical protein C2E20_5928 [Micractinium conductrix]|eukprot:PSC70769.1 hypothetical protein C2E20_5928 [Micractinium conductrix]